MAHLAGVVESLGASHLGSRPRTRREHVERSTAPVGRARIRAAAEAAEASQVGRAGVCGADAQLGVCGAEGSSAAALAATGAVDRVRARGPGTVLYWVGLLWGTADCYEIFGHPGVALTGFGVSMAAILFVVPVVRLWPRALPAFAIVVSVLIVMNVPWEILLLLGFACW